MGRRPCVYILASGRHGTLYIGVTSNLLARLHQHRSGEVPGFTSRYGVHRLVHFEMLEDMPAAIAREKQLKAWRRDWKIALIERDNPFWEDRAIILGFPPLDNANRLGPSSG
ncbi:MAG TPA: GIY-YIG nuclease family protein [Sphingomonas sp.]|nr:GIY-YIG nuclease family protein [Sphingomonas sp.]